MKKNFVIALGLCSVVLFTGCKSRESAYRQAWEQAMAQDKTQQTNNKLQQKRLPRTKLLLLHPQPQLTQPQQPLPLTIVMCVKLMATCR